LKTKDAELENVLGAHRTVIKVVGTGGAGNNTITRLTEVEVKAVETIAVNIRLTAVKRPPFISMNTPKLNEFVQSYKLRSLCCLT